MGLKFIGGIETASPALLPARAAFTISGPTAGETAGDRPRRVHITLQNANGETLNARGYVPFYLSNSSLGRSTALTSALTSGTIAASLPFAITSRGSLEVFTPGRNGIVGTNTLGRARLNVSNASNVTVGRRHLVLVFPNGDRSVSSRITISS